MEEAQIFFNIFQWAILDIFLVCFSVVSNDSSILKPTNMKNNILASDTRIQTHDFLKRDSSHKHKTEHPRLRYLN